MTIDGKSITNLSDNLNLAESIFYISIYDESWLLIIQVYIRLFSDILLSLD